MENEIILGIDPGTKITGYGIIQKENKKIFPLDFGCIRPPYSMDLNSRYLVIFEGIEKLIAKYSPTVVAIETQFIKTDPKIGNAQSALKLGMARGCAIIAAKKNNLPVFEYAPRKAKLSIVGVGSASKHQIQKMVAMQLNINNQKIPEDAADALAIALCHVFQKRY